MRECSAWALVMALSVAFLWHFSNIVRYGQMLIQEPSQLVLYTEVGCFLGIVVIAIVNIIRALRRSSMYQVWTKAEYEDNWKLTDCPDIAAVEDIIRANFGKEVAVKVSVPVEFDARIAVKVHAPTGAAGEPNAMAAVEKRLKEGTKSEAAESETQPDKGTGGKSHGKVRRGDAAVAEGLDKGSGDNSADHSAADR